MANGIDTAMEPVESLVCQRGTDRARRETHEAQL
jgi:hypothetical protein